jgi:hypothetical protein
MLNRFSVTLLVLAVTFTSCDPGIGVVISNKSRVDKNIRVIYPLNYRLPINTRDRTNDSLKTYDHTQTDNTINARDYYRNPKKIPILLLDTIRRTYSFNLKAKHEVIIESRWPASLPTFGQIIIIDNIDTVKLIRHGKDFEKRPKLLLGGSWTHTINDD